MSLFANHYLGPHAEPEDEGCGDECGCPTQAEHDAYAQSEMEYYAAYFGGRVKDFTPPALSVQGDEHNPPVHCARHYPRVCECD